jgi:NAD-dependent dihydropyrimidine dehydrogenase PreA subunit
MKNKRGNKKGSSGGYCYCPRCNYSKKHHRGRPCREDYCPHCNVVLLRADDTKKPVLVKSPISDKKKEKRDAKGYPHINTELCTGCALCVDICPAGALHMLDGHAQVNISSCRQCRICVKECPAGAIA